MLIKKRPDLRYSDVTPKKLYLRRREFIAGSAALAACAVAGPLIGKGLQEAAQEAPKSRVGALPQKPEIAKRSRLISADDKITSFQDAAGFTNFYEFSTAKRDPTVLARDLRLRPWEVSVEGLVKAPQKFAVDDLIRLCARMDQEIKTLKAAERMLRDERAQLLRKNEDARSKVEAMIVRLRSLEQES